MSESYPISTMPLAYVPIGDKTAKAPRLRGDDGTFFWFKGKWRNIRQILYVPQSKDNTEHFLVLFSGLTEARRIHCRVEFPCVWQGGHTETIMRGEFFGQKDNLPLEEGIHPYWRNEDIDPNKKFNVNWATDFNDKDWRGRWSVSKEIKAVHSARNRNFFKYKH